MQIEVRGLDMGYGSFILMHDLNSSVNRGDIFIIMGGSGSGKSTLLKILIGLKEPLRGQVKYGDVSLWEIDASERDTLMRRFGILYQSGALWSSLTLAENVALPLQMYTTLPPAQMEEIVSLKLAWWAWRVLRSFTPRRSAGECARGRGWPGPWPWTATSVL